MSEMSTPEVVTIGAVALLVIKEAFAMVKASRVKNGHSAPGAASVKPQDAIWFANTQAKTLRGVNRLLRHYKLDQEQESELE